MIHWPYGGFGVNYELGLNDYFAPTAGIGYMSENVGWNVGMRIYYPSRDYKFRGRITALYGTNTVLEKWGNYETRSGFSGGVGFNWRFGKKWAFDSDLFLVNADIPDGYEKKSNEIFISLGFSYRW